MAVRTMSAYEEVIGTAPRQLLYTTNEGAPIGSFGASADYHPAQDHQGRRDADTDEEPTPVEQEPRRSRHAKSLRRVNAERQLRTQPLRERRRRGHSAGCDPTTVGKGPSRSARS
jgi:hypothetical protein